MSDLSELIEINRNIEKQNEEIIRLLKKIAGEDDTSDEVIVEEESVEEKLIFDDSLDVGEVFFISNDSFRLTVKNNEVSIVNLTGDDDCSDYSLAEIIANKSIENNTSLDDATVILTHSSKGKLPETLRHCIDNGAKKAFIPWDQMAELIRAPQELQILLKLDFYKTDDELIEKII